MEAHKRPRYPSVPATLLLLRIAPPLRRLSADAGARSTRAKDTHPVAALMRRAAYLIPFTWRAIEAAAISLAGHGWPGGTRRIPRPSHAVPPSAAVRAHREYLRATACAARATRAWPDTLRRCSRDRSAGAPPPATAESPAGAQRVAVSPVPTGCAQFPHLAPVKPPRTSCGQTRRSEALSSPRWPSARGCRPTFGPHLRREYAWVCDCVPVGRSLRACHTLLRRHVARRNSFGVCAARCSRQRGSVPAWKCSSLR